MATGCQGLSGDQSQGPPRALVFCGEAPEAEEEEAPLTDSTDGLQLARAAVVMVDKLWHEREVLNVYFDDPADVLRHWSYGGKRLTVDVILQWASVWNPEEIDKIPIFEQVSSRANADIRVELSESQGCWAMVGNCAEKVRIPEPTMCLNLSDKYARSDSTKRSLVIHEFGHVLGLEHEHQRSDFWEALEKYIDIHKMCREFASTRGSKKGKSSSDKDWFLRTYSTTDGIRRFLGIKPKYKGIVITDYDPESIMHYGFDICWFTNPKLRDFRAIDKLSEKELPYTDRKYIKGVHTRQTGLARDPSQTDLSSLRSAYGVRD